MKLERYKVLSNRPLYSILVPYLGERLRKGGLFLCLLGSKQESKARLFTRQSYMFTRSRGCTPGTLVLPMHNHEDVGS
jgi:hypothetical protein